VGRPSSEVQHFAGDAARTGAFGSAIIEWGPGARSPIGSADLAHVRADSVAHVSEWVSQGRCDVACRLVERIGAR